MSAKVFLGDLSYLTDANQHNLYTPLNIGYCASYTKHKFGTDVGVGMFKEAISLIKAVQEYKPLVVGLSLYYWNAELTKVTANTIKHYSPETFVVIGGPCIDTDKGEQDRLFAEFPSVDAIVPNEGEQGFANLVGRQLGGDQTTVVAGATIRGFSAGAPIGLSTNLAEAPSPYLAGYLDVFLGGHFQPLIQTSRLCPYTCLTGDTLVNTIYGNLPIKELAEKYGDAGVPVYTYDPNTKRAFIAQGINIRKYGVNKDIVRVHFDDGTHIDCTPDHQFLEFARHRQWACEAKDLVPGSRVRALRFETHPSNRVYVQWGRGSKRQLRYRMVMEYLLGRKLTRKEHIHHIDHNPGNDHPDNLQHFVSAAEHLKAHPENSVRMKEKNPTRFGISQEWRQKLSASGRGKTRSIDSRYRYRESKLGKRNPNYKDGQFSGRSSRIDEVNHKVVKVEKLTELADVYCLTVPETGWFFANNVLVKNCAFCVSGKDRGKLRAFPLELVRDELAYIAKKFKGHPDTLFYITDENFGIMERDLEVADYILETQKKHGYPNRIFYYNDKRFTQISRSLHEKVGKMCWHGVCLSLQSENPEALKAIKRRNLTDEQLQSALAWAKGLKLKTSTELIFGLPGETLETFCRLVDKCARFGFDVIHCYNLMLFSGIEMYRKKYREEHKLETRKRFRYVHNVGGQEVVETDEVVISADTFTKADFAEICKLGSLLQRVYEQGWFKEEVKAWVEYGHSLTGLLRGFWQPLEGDDPAAKSHQAYVYANEEKLFSLYDGGAEFVTSTPADESYYNVDYFPEIWTRVGMRYLNAVRANNIQVSRDEAQNVDTGGNPAAASVREIRQNPPPV